jgi:hypothetical protein
VTRRPDDLRFSAASGGTTDTKRLFMPLLAPALSRILDEIRLFLRA